MGDRVESVFDQLEKLRASLVEDTDGVSEMNRRHKAELSLLPTWSIRLILGGGGFSPQFIEKSDSMSNCEKIKAFLETKRVHDKLEIILKEISSSVETRGRKDLKKSRLFMRKGSQLYDEGQYDKALNLFNKGLIHAPFPDDCQDEPAKNYLAMCLSKRCRAFRMLNKLHESWYDMKDSIAFMRNPEMAQSLVQAKSELLKEIVGTTGGKFVPGMDLDIDRFDIKLDSKSENLHGTIESLRIAYSPEKGRHIITDKPIERHETVIAEEPYSCLLTPSLYDSYCAHCLRSLKGKPFPCRGCTFLKFCCSRCSEESWNSYHSKECKFMAILQYLFYGHLALRTVIIAGVENALDIYKRQGQTDSASLESSRSSFSNTFEDIFTLVAHDGDSKRMDMKFISFITSAAFLSLLAQSMSLIESHCLYDFGGLLLKLMLQIDVNSLSIGDDTRINPNGTESLWFAGRGKEIGSGLYATASLLNHSCDRNCDRLFVGSKIIVNADRPIGKGQEITITYGPHKDQLSFEERQEHLMENFFFKCACEVCQTHR